MDEWPKINVSRFEGEDADEFEWRSTRLIALVTRFRRGFYQADEAELMDAELDILLDPGGNHAKLRQDIEKRDRHERAAEAPIRLVRRVAG